MLILEQFTIRNGDVLSQIYSLLYISDLAVFETALFLAGHPFNSHAKTVSNQLVRMFMLTGLWVMGKELLFQCFALSLYFLI